MLSISITYPFKRPQNNVTFEIIIYVCVAPSNDSLALQQTKKKIKLVTLL